MPTQQFKQFIDNLRTFNFADAQDRAIQTNTETLAQYQVEQFAQGRDKNDKPILLEGHGYAVSTIIRKRLFGRGLGAIVDRITLFQTGALYRETFAKMQGKQVVFSSDVSYFKPLMQRTGDVTGLDEQNRIDFAFTYNLPFVSRELFKKTGLHIKVGERQLI